MTSIDDLPIRDDLRGLRPYGAPQRPVAVRLNVNENTHGLPEGVATDVVTAVAEAVLGINRYPDREFELLRGSLAGYLGWGIDPDQVWAANGSNEVLQHVLQAFGGPGRTLLGFPPTYSMHSIIARTTGTGWLEGAREGGFALSADSVVRDIEALVPDVVFLCSPNNPTGTALDLDVIEAAYDAHPGILLVDEAYAEFTTGPTALSLLAGRPRLLVSRTMSKAFAFAGARLGYLAADPAIIDALRLVRLPYHLSALTQAAAVAALAHASEMLATVSDIVRQRDRMAAGLAELGYDPHPSDANFVLFGNVTDPSAVFEALLESDIIVRDVGIAHHLRVTAGTAVETDLFLAAMARIGNR